jgi:hypothetical protein
MKFDILACFENLSKKYRLACFTWSMTLREERRLRVFENRVLRRIFGPKRDEVTGEWRKLHNEELHDLYSSPTTVRVMKSRRMRWAGYVTRMGEGRGVYRVLVGNPEGKRPLGDPGVDGRIILTLRRLTTYIYVVPHR